MFDCQKNVVSLHQNLKRKEKAMARPIRETPILFGKDARRFEEEMKRVEAISPEVRRANREKFLRKCEEIENKWNLEWVYPER